MPAPKEFNTLELRDEWEERAAIIEESCKVDRLTAERMATAVVRRRIAPKQLSLIDRALAKAADNGRP
jgi:hypothetical protein